MAQGFLQKYQGESYEVHSAGMDPKPEVHPLAVKVMAEAGIDISRNTPKWSKDYLGRLPVKHLLIVCDKANQSCPRIWPGTFSRSYMPFDDPAEAERSDEEKLSVFRRVRDEIGAAMKTWKPQLTK
jgi:arsenate reductase